MRNARVLVAAAVLVGASVAVFAQDDGAPAKRKRRPAPVSIVQDAPLDVVVSGTPLPVDVTVSGPPLPVAIASMPPVDVASLPAVTITSLPPVAISSLPSVTVANATPLDVRVTNATLPTAPAANATVVLSDLNDVTLTSDFTSADIDCDGYRSASVFVSCSTFQTTPTYSDLVVSVEFGCSGIFNSERGVSPNNLGGGATPLVTSRDVLGPRLRVKFTRENLAVPFPTVSNVKVAIYLRR